MCGATTGGMAEKIARFLVDIGKFYYLCPNFNLLLNYMNKRILFTALFMAAAVVTGYAQDKLYADEFPLGDVTLLDGPLKKARDLNIQTLLKYDCDRLLAPYLKEAGLTPKAKSYPNWDGLDGHVIRPAANAWNISSAS